MSFDERRECCSRLATSRRRAQEKVSAIEKGGEGDELGLIQLSMGDEEGTKRLF